MIYILGANNGDALQYAKQREMKAGTYKFVTTPEKLQGVDGRQNTLAVTGNAADREDYDLIVRALRDRGFSI